MPRIDLQDKPICITGASSGIGAATAYACARAGMPVVLAARRAERLEALAREITKEGGRARTTVCDVTDPDACQAMVDQCVSGFGSVYAVFANAGFGFIRPFHEASDADLRGIFETNFWGSLNAIRPALEHMMRAQSGHILFCSSCLSRFALPNYGHYSATKASQLHMGSAMRHELRPYGIHVSTVLPIGTRTEFFETSHRIGGRIDPVATNSPSLFMQKPERVARAVVKCLCRPKAEVWTSFSMRVVAAGITLCPNLASWAMGRVFRDRVGPAGDASAQSESPPQAPSD